MGLLIAGLVLHALWYDFTSDDAFIVARYARNVVEGHGWVWNVGERVEGYTSLFWVGLTAALGALGVDFATAARGLSQCASIGCVVVLYLFAGRLGLGRNWLGYVAPSLLVCSASVACWSLGGLEACGFAFLILLTLFLASANRPAPPQCLLAGMAGGLCALARPEGVGVAILIGVLLCFTPSRRRLGPLMAYAIPVALITGAHLLWRLSYYGQSLPNTYHAKVGSGPAVWAQGARYLHACMSDNGGVIAWLLPFAASWVLPRDYCARMLATVGLAMFAGIVLVGGDGLAMHRFLVPVMPIWLLLWAKLLVEVPVAVAKRSTRIPARAWQIVSIAISIGLAALLAMNPATSWQYLLYREHRIEVPNWIAVGKWLREHAPPGATVACVPIGAIGYHSRLPVFDMLGLTDRHIARKEMPLGGGWAGHEKHDGPYILSREPTFLLLGNVQVHDRPLAVDDPQFMRPPVPSIRHREDDIFTPELRSMYGPCVVRLENGRYLHFLRRYEPRVSAASGSWASIAGQRASNQGRADPGRENESGRSIR